MACLMRRYSISCKTFNHNLRRFMTGCSVRKITASASSFQSETPVDTSCPRTIKDVENELIQKFKDSNVSEAEESANFIIAHACGHKTLFSVPKHQVLDECRLTIIENMVQQRLQHIPVQYVLKEWDFKDITLSVKPPVFIPRPETEELIDHMLTDPAVTSAEHFIEIGPGSGAICLSLLNQCPGLRCTAFEAGTGATGLTWANAESLKLSERLTLHNIALKQDNLETVIRLAAKPVDFIVSNPPYILTKDMQNLQKEIALYEDELALDGGQDGLNVIRPILDLARRLLKPDGSVWLETDSSHPMQIKALAENYGLNYCKTIKDFGQHDRFCHLTRR